MSAAAATADAGAAPAKKGKKKLLIIVIAVVLLVVVGGGAAVFMMKKKAAAQAAEDGDEVAASAEHKSDKPDPKHPLGWLPRVDWNRSSRSSKDAVSRHVRANRMATGENTSALGHLAPRSVLRPESHA